MVGRLPQPTFTCAVYSIWFISASEADFSYSPQSPSVNYANCDLPSELEAVLASQAS